MDELLGQCLIQACANLLERGEAIVVSPPAAGGKILYVWFDEEESSLKISEVDKTDSVYEDAGMTTPIVKTDLKIGQRFWLFDSKPH